MECQLTTVEGCEVNFAALNTDICLRIVTDGPRCRDILGEMSGKTLMRVMAMPEVPLLTLSAGDLDSGVLQDSQVDFGASPADIYACRRNTLFTYSARFVAPALAVLGAAPKASFRIDAGGILCLQLMVPAGLSTAFLEFVVAPLAEEGLLATPH
jgi:hypothetical protein